MRLLAMVNLAIFTADDALRRAHGEAPNDGEAAAARATASAELPPLLAALQAAFCAACERCTPPRGIVTRLRAGPMGSRRVDDGDARMSQHGAAGDVQLFATFARCMNEHSKHATMDCWR